MEIDLDGLLQLMEMINTEQPNSNSYDQRRQKIMLAMLKLMETKKLMEGYEAPHNEGEYADRHLHMLMALRPHMTGERRHMIDILIKVFEIRQIMNLMGADVYGH